MKKQDNAEIKGSTIVLAFDRYEEREELEMAMKGADFHSALFDIAQEVFRPHRKHGYPDVELDSLNEKEEVNKAISLLEKKFFQILEEYKIEL